MLASGAIDLLTLWGHSLAALLFAALAAWTWRQPRRRRGLATALALTALWALAVAGLGSGDGVTRLAETLRNLGWLAFLWRAEQAGAQRSRTVFYAVLASIVVAGGAIGSAGAMIRDPAMARALVDAGVVLRLLASVAALVLVQHVHARATGASLRAATLGIAAMWLVDANILTLAWATGSWPDAILAMRGAVMVVVAAVFAADLQRQDDRPIQLSRAVAVQSLSLLAVLSYFAIFASVTEGLAIMGGTHARVLQTAFVFGSTAALLAVLASPAARAWLRVKAMKHLFRHRYDYRAEWMRFTETLGHRADGDALDARVIRAIAELLDAPGGVLLTLSGDTLVPAAEWRWDAAAMPVQVGDDLLARHLGATGRVIELDAIRAGGAPADADTIPAALLDCAEAWAIVPLPHGGGLVGAIVLARPPLPRALDWEDFDLLKVAGRQAASSLAEQQAQARLVEAERFDEFNRRFAFILHDIKNLVSQLSLVARNAERHADNPAFRADMVATLNESAGRMTELVARLSQDRAPRTDAPRAVPLLGLAETLAGERRLTHPVVVTGDPAAIALADSAGTTQVLRHLIQNAIEASPPGEPVGVAVRIEGPRVVAEVIDRGCGMSAAFMRDRLFKPFVSTKPAGFGIGTYEARAIAAAMGGAIEVSSREGEGSRFRLILPSVSSMERAA
ncbi:XrtA/PEP-CTERM system histidine kinase PrsK [Sphingomonas yantingensis]|uniref:histidine kinase n=1 Tax=Sphingomonas yantingensis TaxID=1241761 RepID=A0A7W9AS69_9SPHN|nr:XrtA/PEP-CTERM system histidine kinase PrsK [Sphingomonas yantingensis]MBB5699593.1 putative PEP-CTERM system histidine kinase [Sphingomonas yantingensis]